ncbi:MAG: phosphatase PAP2 family protein [Firmicutes bacterium]|nr:phosphatase PAP2 family protein [Bacillota bacterium]
MENENKLKKGLTAVINKGVKILKVEELATEFKELNATLLDATLKRKREIKIFLFCFFAIAIALIVVASFFDYEIATRLYNPQAVIATSRTWLQFPTFSAVTVLFVALFTWASRKRKSKDKKEGKRGYSLFVMLASLMFGMAFSTVKIWNFSQINFENITETLFLNGWWLFALIGIALFWLIILGFRFINDNILKKIIYFLLILVLIWGLSYAVAFVFKIVWARARYVDIFYSEVTTGFTHWFNPNFSYFEFNLRNSAFFSGHTIVVAVWMLLLLLPTIFNIKNKVVVTILFIIPFLMLALITYLSMVAGRHYFSDMVFAIVTVAVVSLLFIRFIIFRGKIGKNHKKEVASSKNDND